MIEGLGIVLGIVGTFMMSSASAARREWRLVVWILYSLSNGCLIYVGIQRHVVALWLMQGVYLGFGIRGILNNR